MCGEKYRLHTTTIGGFNMYVRTDTIKNFRTILVRGLPRQGKTRWAISQLAQSGSGIYLTHRHEIIKHAVKIFSEITKDKTCVWVEGKARSCRTGKLNCEKCPMKPDEKKEDHIGYFELERIVEKLLDKYKILTKERIIQAESPDIIEKYGGLCPYYCMKIAVTKARYVFTVPQLAHEVPFKEVLVVDEDPTVDHFYPQSVCICEYTHNNKERNVKILVPDRVKKFTEVKNIHHAKDIRKAAEFLLKIEEILQEFKEAKVPIQELMNKLNDLQFPEIDDPEAVLRRIEELYPSDDVTTFFEPILFPAPKRFFVENNSNGSRVKVWMIADEEQICRPIPPSHKQIIIGTTRAKLFAEQVFGSYYEMKLNPSLQFLRNFVIIPVEVSVEDEDGKYVSKHLTRRLLERVIDRFQKNNVPVLVVTGSEEQQERCATRLRERRLLVYPVKKESLEQMRVIWHGGHVAIVYANSNISRGVDLNFYDVSVIYNIDFSTPYWSAMAEYYQNIVTPGSEKAETGASAERYEMIREKIISDELFNLMFRIAPIKGDGELEAKFVFIPSYYMDRILTTANALGYLTQIEERVITNWIDKEDVIEKIPDIISTYVKRVEFKEQNIEKKVSESSDTPYISRFATFILLPDERIYEIVEDNRLIEHTCTFVEENKNKLILDFEIYEKAVNTLASIFGSARRLSSSVLKSNLKKRLKIREERQLSAIIRQLQIDGYVRRRKEGRKIYYELIKKEVDGNEK